MAQTERQKAYVEAWQKEHVRRVVIKLNKRTDADILAELDKQESKQGFIKQAIRAYINVD